MKPEHLESLQEVAKHFQGGKTRFKHLPRTLENKVLPGAWTDIRTARNGSELARGLIAEDWEHHNVSDYHRGGGLLDGLTGLVGWGWNMMTSAVEPLQWIQSGWDWANGYKHDTDIPSDVKSRVDLLGQVKKGKDSRQNVHGWVYDKTTSTDRVGVWIDEGKKEIHTVVRGTDTSLSVSTLRDLWDDAHVLVGKQAGDTDQVKQTLLNIVDKYSAGYDLDTLGYSLGASQITTVFTDTSPEIKKKLDEYSEIVLVSPGGSPFNTTQVKEILKDDRTTLLTNRSDAISAMYTTNAVHNDQSFYGPHTYWPGYAHSWEQFSNTPETWKENDPMISNKQVETAALAAVGLD